MSITNSTLEAQKGSAEAPILVLGISEWRAEECDHENIVNCLEEGQVLYFPSLPFVLTEEEQALLDPRLVSPKRKNIMYQADQESIKGIADSASENEKRAVEGLLKRYSEASYQLLTDLIPQYKGKLHSPMNTLRLNAIDEWSDSHSFRKDDRRLHVDAFPSRPLHGRRIIRIFNNINPSGVPRKWRVGEPFPQLAARLLPKSKPYSRIGSALLDRLQITKSRRTHYDHIMLQFHDLMKEDQEYQDNGIQWDVSFMPGSTWICFSDQTPHAAMSGQFMLEQTFQLDVDDMVDPAKSPLKVLEAMVKKPLV
ncbi:Kdo hydroxylase family protein [Ignatzschineria indica]|uniref:Kdo hydroxylase family protein n=1 Tax=Ignatzschineria TaxID=112008 RepID=UPI000B99334E|nr:MULTISPECIES: Kdo hydroxylase family protein [Ignatzschineria]MDM1545809.1 Kdo hydroxylase family protein [Ignatzschineria indica]OYQ81163.1 3-deoxy-D-manno-oct-2-ulosonic acid (Kdo) hydroxylase [Ignatzschineria sp. F8392]